MFQHGGMRHDPSKRQDRQVDQLSMMTLGRCTTLVQRTHFVSACQAVLVSAQYRVPNGTEPRRYQEGIAAEARQLRRMPAPFMMILYVRQSVR